jgi:beta-galactosidase
VTVWSIGNENPATELLYDTGRRAKQLDPTRLICYPMTPTVFKNNFDTIPEFVDLYDEHYPGDAELLELAKKVKRPMVFSEYVHAWGLGFDRLQDQWEVMQATPQFAGGAIWHFQDQGLLLKSKKSFDPQKPIGAVWLDEKNLFDTHDADGCDGIVYSDRTPQTDFFETRKVYSPVQIAEKSAAVQPGAQEISLTVENRHDFRALAGMKLAWSLQRNGAEIQSGEVPLKAAAHEKETVRIAVNIPADASKDVLALNVRCVDEKDFQITERAVRLELAEAKRGSWISHLPAADQPVVTEGETELKITLPQWSLAVERATGSLTLRDAAGKILVAGIFPHSGRKFILNDRRLVGEMGRGKQADVWPASTLTKLDVPEIKITKQKSTVRLTVSGSYPRTDATNQAFVGGYQADILPSGAITISYDFAPKNSKAVLLEAGLSIVLPDSLAEFRWIGQGPYAGYPGKDRLDESGIFHLNRDDLYFQGNRRETELALLTAASGTGIALMTQPGDVAVERAGDTTILSHNAVLSGLGNKGVPPVTLIKAKDTPHITGSFTLVPLGENWPAQLTRWFGQPSGAKEIFKPFYHSYDQ